MTCPLTCYCSANVCFHREMKKAPGRKRRGAHAARKFNELQKERAKFNDGRGWERVIRSQQDAQARREVREQDRENERARRRPAVGLHIGDGPTSATAEAA